MKICAGIVLYNPNLSKLKKCIESIRNQVDRIIIIDNSSKNTEEILKIISDYNNCVSYIKNDKNEGIAHALNQILEFSINNNYAAFITLDQDSICKDELVKNYVAIFDKSVGQISCNILDVNTGGIDSVSFNGTNTKQVPYCITSGCLNNTLAVKKVGGYNEELFIDGVDLDLSCNLRKHGYKVICVNYDGLLHELGEGKQINIFGKKVPISNHVPWRNYYARRNLIFVARKYYKGKEKYMRIIKQIVYALGAVVLEDNKIERFKKNWKGIIDGCKMPIK